MSSGSPSSPPVLPKQYKRIRVRTLYIVLFFHIKMDPCSNVCHPEKQFKALNVKPPSFYDFSNTCITTNEYVSYFVDNVWQQFRREPLTHEKGNEFWWKNFQTARIIPHISKRCKYTLHILRMIQVYIWCNCNTLLKLLVLNNLLHSVFKVLGNILRQYGQNLESAMTALTNYNAQKQRQQGKLNFCPRESGPMVLHIAYR